MIFIRQVIIFYKVEMDLLYFLYWKINVVFFNFGKLRRMLGYFNGFWVYVYKYFEIKCYCWGKKKNKFFLVIRKKVSQNFYEYKYLGLQKINYYEDIFLIFFFLNLKFVVEVM